MQLRDKWVWAFTLKLIKDKDYHMSEIPNDLKQLQVDALDQDAIPHVILVRNEGRSFQLIRILAVDTVWGSLLTRDIRSLADQAKEFKKRLRAKQLTILNLYVFPFPKDDHILEPITDHHVIVEDHSTLINNALFFSERYDQYELGIEDTSDIPQFGIDQQLFQEIRPQNLEWVSLEEILAEIKAEEKKKEKEFHSIFHYGKPYATYFFLIVNILVFLWIEWQGSSSDPETLIRFGAKWPPAIIEGEYWRFITPMFLHIGFIHIAMNSLALYYLGNVVEKIYGSFRYVWMYLFAGFTGTLASFIFSPNLAAGASGAIFGCFGALLYFGLHYKNLFFRTLGNDVIMILLINLGIGFVFPMIDNFGHIGGLMGGFFAAMMLSLPHKPRPKERVLACILVTVFIIAGLGLGLSNTAEHPDTLLIQADMELRQENFEQAMIYLEKAIELGNQRPEVFLQLGAVYNQLGKFEQAEHILIDAERLGADQAELYFQLSYSQIQQNNYVEAEKNLLETIYRNPEIVEAYHNLALVYAEQGNYTKAIEVLDQAKAKELKDERLEELYHKILEQQANEK